MRPRGLRLPGRRREALAGERAVAILPDRGPGSATWPPCAARAVGARICPYEITRAALAFNDAWIGDYNYVFSPDTRGLFYERPGFDPARTLLLVDEAHNLPSRAADAHSHSFTAEEARAVCDSLRQESAHAKWVSQWEDWARFLEARRRSPALSEGERGDARDQLERLSEGVANFQVDYAALGPQVSALIWRIPSAAAQLASLELPRLWWSPHDGMLSITCLDAAQAIGASLREFGGVVLATATPGPAERFAQACGIGPLNVIRAPTPWRDNAYDVAVDLRVDTTFQHRQRHVSTTAQTIESVHRSAGPGAPIAVFFPSYAYAEAVCGEVPGRGPPAEEERAILAVALGSPRPMDRGQALFLVLGSSFAEGIDLLGRQGGPCDRRRPGPSRGKPRPEGQARGLRAPGEGRRVRPRLQDSRDAEGEPGPWPAGARPRPEGARPPALQAVRRAGIRAPSRPGIPGRQADPRGRRPRRMARLRPVEPISLYRSARGLHY